MKENAVIYHAVDSADTSRGKLMGRHVAGEGFLNGLAAHAGTKRFFCLPGGSTDFQDFKQRVGAVAGRNAEAVQVKLRDVGGAGVPGVLHLPGPDIEPFAWSRRYGNARAYSLCGLTHTIATERVLDGFGRLLTGPVQPWDAVICTSRAVADSVRHALDSWGEFLARRLDAKPRPLVQLPVIPLGVDVPALAAVGRNAALRKKWRERLNIAADDLCVLYVGRLSFHAKAHPLPMYLALQEASLTTNRRIHLVQAGWFANKDLEKQFKDMAAAFSPAVNAIFVDGRTSEARAEIWSCGDVFVSLSDNIQETFGISPVEAMAAGLPVVASDWNGYRDTVRDGIDGFLVPTLFPRAGAGEILSYRFHTHADSYDRYLGHVSQCTAVDVSAAARAFARLFADDTARRQMGEAGRKRAESAFDWSVVIKAYQELWAELGRRRKSDGEIAGREPHQPAHPLREDPFALFAGYPTHRLDPDQMLAVREGADMARLEAILSFQANAFAGEFLAPKERCEIVLRTLRTFGPRRVRDIIQLFPKPHQEGVTRSLGWLAKTGLLDFNVAAPAAADCETKEKETA